jgi:hypothetical protein
MYIKWLFILITFVLSAYPQNVSEQVILPGKEYTAGTRVLNTYQGVSFIIPRDWQGAMPPDQNILLMSSERKAGIGIAIYLSELSQQDVIQYLKQPQNLGDNIILKPAGEPHMEGSRFSMNYIGINGVGKALAISGAERNAVLLLFAGPATDTTYFQNLLKKLGNSVVFSKPDPTKLGRAWQKALGGKMLKKVIADDSEGSFPAVSHLCPGGAGHFASQDNFEKGDNDPTLVDGTWKIETSGTRAFLVVYPLGKKPIKVSLDSIGNTIILQGERYFLTSSDVCK